MRTIKIGIKMILIKVKNIIYVAGIFLALVNVMGCASSKEQVFGKTMSTMKEIHDKKFDQQQGVSRADIQRPINDDKQDLHGEIKTTVDHLEQDFVFLPNPTMVMYIYHHLTLAGRPVPAYSTYFTFYERRQVAIPGEAGYQ